MITPPPQVADFGLARSLLKSDHSKGGDGNGAVDILTDYVATRWYRAPEILLGSDKYMQPVDMWSLGCIFGEMLGGKPVFSGKSTLNQLELVFSVLGWPSAEDISSFQSNYAQQMLSSLNISAEAKNEKSEEEQKAAWATFYPSATSDAIDLMTKLMQVNPTKRMRADEGLKHPYCIQFHDPDSEICAKRSVGCTIAAPVGGRASSDSTGAGAYGDEKTDGVFVDDNKKEKVQYY